MKAAYGNREQGHMWLWKGPKVWNKGLGGGGGALLGKKNFFVEKQESFVENKTSGNSLCHLNMQKEKPNQTKSAIIYAPNTLFHA